jgi:uncharacterized membrane protein YgdD (TMEM256/DUF423 family)
MNYRVIIFLGAILAATGVAAGAIGAHLLEKRIEVKQREQFETAVRYQIYHALGLILIGILAHAHPSRWLTAAAAAMLAGCLLFCGGLFGYVTAVAMDWPLKFLVHIVPFGGGLFIVSWVLVAIGAAEKSVSSAPPS